MRALIAVATVVPFCACSMLEDDVARTHDRSAGYTVGTAYMTADARIVTQRIQPVTHQPVVCVEPSPDAIKAVSTSAKGDIKGGNGAVTGELGLSGTSAEAAAELAGRSTALLGLREGVFRACEAYANGIIGSDAYSLVLARYGQTMTTLFLAQDIAKAARTSGKTLAEIRSPQPPDDSSKPSPAPPSKTAEIPSPSRVGWLPQVWPAVSVSGAGHHKAGESGTSQSPPSKTDLPAAAGAPATAALALLRMNEDYMLQPQALIPSLVVACIEENDPTRFHATTDNAFLMPLCNQLKDLDAIEHYTRLYGQLAADARLVEPVTSVSSKQSAVLRR